MTAGDLSESNLKPFDGVDLSYEKPLLARTYVTAVCTIRSRKYLKDTIFIIVKEFVKQTLWFEVCNAAMILKTLIRHYKMPYEAVPMHLGRYLNLRRLKNSLSII